MAETVPARLVMLTFVSTIISLAAYLSAETYWIKLDNWLTRKLCRVEPLNVIWLSTVLTKSVVYVTVFEMLSLI